MVPPSYRRAIVWIGIEFESDIENENEIESDIEDCIETESESESDIENAVENGIDVDVDMDTDCCCLFYDRPFSSPNFASVLPPPPPPPSQSYREVHEAHPILHDLQLREQDHPGPAVAVHQVPLCAPQARADTGAPAARRGRRKVSQRGAAAPVVVAVVIVRTRDRSRSIN